MKAIGRQLCAAREARGETLSHAAAETRIKIQILEQMEAGDFSQIAAPMYAKGFIRLYAGYLGLDPDPLLQDYLQALARGPAPDEAAEATAAEGSLPARLEQAVRRYLERVARDRVLRVAWVGALALVLLAVLLGLGHVTRRFPAGGAAAAESGRRQEALPGGILQEPPEPYFEHASPRENS